MERLITLKNILPYLKMAFWPGPENDFRPVFIQRRFLALYVLLFLTLKLIIFPFYLFLPKTLFFADVISSSLVELANQERQSIGLNALKQSPVLARAALAKAQDMMNKGYFSHTSPQGLTPWYWFKAFGYSYQVAGENLAIGFIDSEEVSRAWINSPSHRQNLLSANYKEVGIAVVTGNFQGKETSLVVQFFGSPKAAPSVAVKTPVKPKPVSTPTPTTKPTLSPAPTGKPVSTPTPSGIEPQPAASSGVAVLGQEQPEETLAVSPLPLNEEELSLSTEIINFGVTRYDQLASQIIDIFLVCLVAFLIFNLIFSLIQGIKSLDLLLGTSLFIFLLLASSFIDKELIINLIPHQLII